ncbi:serine/threonine-protein kinase [Puia sp.]|uniref:serine/threonine-protein kinase n=1 Tax=Puia sp. TaxID=2045100 RepID=UPI002F3F7EE1
MLLFNRYQYEPSTDLIGKGEFSLVYEALDTCIYLPVAVKIYRAIESTEKFGFVQVNKFMGLDHPNICRYLHMGEIRKENVAGNSEKRQVCVMELLRDGDFASYYRAHRQPELLRKMVLDILHGLTYLHSQRIVHRRLKPSNLLVGMTTQGPVVKITDFGLGSGKATSRDGQFSSMVLEVTRMAPEQFNAREYGFNGSVSYHVDFWALGLAVYEAITDNDILFRNSPRDSREQVIRNILSPKLPDKVQLLPPPFDRFVMRCLAKHAGHRPQNTRELIELLAQPISSPHPVNVSPVAKLPHQEDNSVTEKRTATVPPEREMTVTEDEGVEEAPLKSREVHPFFNRYEYNPVGSLIGKGGFSRVYKAHDKKLNRWVALKFYKTGDYAERCNPVAEVRRVINLDHPNICRYLDIEELEKVNVFGEKEITQVSVMELLDGGNLLEYCATHPTEAVLKRLLNDVLNGLAYLHRSNIIHRDIKPANILIRETSEGPVAKITDFGISKASDAAKTAHSSALVVSIPYMAPEQLNVKKYGVDEKIAHNLDLWALGVTIYEVMTGKVLFKNRDNDSNEEIMANILSPGLQDKIAELPQPFLDIVRRCLVKDAKRRAQRAEELIQLLHKPVAPPPQPGVERIPHTLEMPSYDASREIELSDAAELEAAAEAKGAAEIRPEMRLIPGADTKTQDLFMPEKSWVWAEAVSTPMLDEVRDTVRVPLGKPKWDTGMSIAAVAASVLIFITSYIIMQNHRLSKALQPLPVRVDAINTIRPQRVESVKYTDAMGTGNPSAVDVRRIVVHKNNINHRHKYKIKL